MTPNPKDMEAFPEGGSGGAAGTVGGKGMLPNTILEAVELPNWLAVLEALGANVTNIKEKWAAWQLEHPGLSAPFSEIAGDLWAGIDDTYLVKIAESGAQQIVDFLTKPEGPISTDDDPSIFA
jgi:hypothetical protein